MLYAQNQERENMGLLDNKFVQWLVEKNGAYHNERGELCIKAETLTADDFNKHITPKSDGTGDYISIPDNVQEWALDGIRSFEALAWHDKDGTHMEFRYLPHSKESRSND